MALGITALVLPPWGSLSALCLTTILMLKSGMNPLRELQRPGWTWLMVVLPLGAGLPWRSLSLASLIFLSAYLGGVSSPVMVRNTCRRLLAVLGPRGARTLSTIISMALVFLPWVYRESALRRDALTLRFSGRPVHPLAYLRHLGAPLLVRLFFKTRQTADAMVLRDMGSD